MTLYLRFSVWFCRHIIASTGASALETAAGSTIVRAAGGRVKEIVVIGAGKIGATVAGLLASTGDYQVTTADTRPKFFATSTERSAFASWQWMSRTA
jgi:threonine dehydrogenase-like Zn-dependent dehydrogenase